MIARAINISTINTIKKKHLGNLYEDRTAITDIIFNPASPYAM